MKRFYKKATVKPSDNDQFLVLLDEKEIKTPEKNTLLLPTKKLAEAIADEWNNQQEHISIEAMNTTRMSFGALDINEKQQQHLRDEVAAYAGMDMLCYRDDTPKTLVAKQSAAWDKWLDWAQSELNLDFVTTTGLMPVAQPEETINQVKEYVAKIDKWQLIAMGIIVRVTGSYILSAALLRENISTDELIKTSFIYADYQEEELAATDEADEITAVADFLSCL